MSQRTPLASSKIQMYLQASNNSVQLPKEGRTNLSPNKIECEAQSMINQKFSTRQ